MKTFIRVSFHNNIFQNLLILLSLIVLSACGSGGGSGGPSTLSSYDNTPDQVSDPLLSGSVTLRWSPPASNTDGSPLTDLAGYRIYYGPSSTNYTASVDTGSYTNAVISSLSYGTWCFAITAYDTSGNESDYSVEACTVV